MEFKKCLMERRSVNFFDPAKPVSDEELKMGGVGPSMIRLSVGLESMEDLLWDLDQALHAASI